MSYLLEVSILLILSYLVFAIVLKYTKLFAFSRFFLLSSILFCLASPIIKIDSNINSPLASSYDKVHEWTNSSQESTPILPANFNHLETLENNSFSAATFFTLLYFTICLVFLLRYLRNLISLITLSRKKIKNIAGLNIVLIDKNFVPYSFFNFLFVSKKDYESNGISRMVFQHEQTHAKQLHTLDILFVELITCFFWFHPIIWLYKKSISYNHEYLVDNYMIEHGATMSKYSTEIIETISQFRAPNLVSGFSYMQIKNRINMMEKVSYSKRKRISKMLVALVLLGVTIGLNSFKDKHIKPLIVVLDAGHGGKDPGYRVGELEEKEINLNICRKLAGLSKKGEIEIVLSRSLDEFVSLQGRVEFIKSINADMLLSIHCEGNTSKSEGGVSGFYPRFNSESNSVDSVSMNYSKILVANGLGDLNEGDGIQAANFAVIRDLNCPGVLLSLGNMNNDLERKTLQNNESQNQIAEDIFEKLVQIRQFTN